MNFTFNLQEESSCLYNTISEIIETPTKLTAVAKASYRHPTGFDKIVIKACPKTQHKLRLHFWWPEAPDGDEHIHPHRWEFESLVLMGSLVVKKYECDPLGEEFYKYHYVPPLKNEEFILKSCGKDKIKFTQELHLKKGQGYYQTPHEFHIVKRNSRKLVATLFTTSVPITDSTYFFVENPVTIENFIRVNANRMSEDYVINCLSFLQKSLKAPALSNYA